MDKKVKIIKGADLGTLVRGGNATLYMPDGKIISTSPIEKYFTMGGNIMVETKNTIYVADTGK